MDDELKDRLVKILEQLNEYVWNVDIDSGYVGRSDRLRNEIIELIAELSKDNGQCTACSGSGYYDSDGSPKCGICNGTGRKL